MLSQYIPILLQVLIAFSFATVALSLSTWLGKSAKRSKIKDTAYESGMLPIEKETAPRFSIKFYLVALLFVIFDLEVVFLYPWALVFRDLIAQQSIVLWSALGFLSLVTIAYFYALKKQAFKWN